MSHRNWSTDVAALGDRLSMLTATQATQLNQYLAVTYGIVAEVASAAPEPTPDILVDAGVARATHFDLVLEGYDSISKIALIKGLASICASVCARPRNWLTAHRRSSGNGYQKPRRSCCVSAWRRPAAGCRCGPAFRERKSHGPG